MSYTVDHPTSFGDYIAVIALAIIPIRAKLLRCHVFLVLATFPRLVASMFNDKLQLSPPDDVCALLEAPESKLNHGINLASLHKR